jgi:hypothetical protein
MNDGVTGLYLMAFDLPTPHIYVGIAAAGGRAPEGVLNRMRKHCIKTMGMNGGLGVHHPKKWQQFALARYQFMQQRKTTDKLEDVRFLYGSSSDSNPKATLEHFEAMICSNHQNSLTDICNQLWPETPAGNITLITQGHTQPGNFSEYEIQLS